MTTRSQGAGARSQKASAAQAELRRAGQVLHDHVGPLLVAAGLRLQLLRMDHPEAAEQVNEVLQTLDNAMERVRALSQELSPSPFSVPPYATPPSKKPPSRGK